ncbi:MAG: sulfatase-like hydrolase/transferase [Verrucomicrobiales bacterium]|nr:sulfatase-like hydrolase/transferase [Verrucomicrobiales bacterium]
MKRLIWIVAVFLFSISPGHSGDAKNVLWIYLEDVSGWFSCYGDELIETPHIDALAKSGTKFTRFYTPAGVCSATRSAIVTGMMQTSTGAHNHRSCRPDFRGKSMGKFDENILPDDVVPLPKRFKEAGFWTFNDGGKDDYNFTFDLSEFYDQGPYKGWGPNRFTFPCESPTLLPTFFMGIQLKPYEVETE